MTGPGDRRLGRIEFDPQIGFTMDDARALREGTQNRQASARAMHAVLEQTGELARHTLLEYRCRASGRGCLLLRVFQTPEGPAVYRPAFRYSAERNAATDAQARASRTSDGVRRWQENVDLLDVDPPVGLGVEIWANCDHVLDHPVRSERINADLAARRGEVVLLPDDHGAVD